MRFSRTFPSRLTALVLAVAAPPAVAQTQLGPPGAARRVTGTGCLRICRPNTLAVFPPGAGRDRRPAPPGRVRSGGLPADWLRQGRSGSRRGGQGRKVQARFRQGRDRRPGAKHQRHHRQALHSPRFDPREDQPHRPEAWRRVAHRRRSLCCLHLGVGCEQHRDLPDRQVLQAHRSEQRLPKSDPHLFERQGGLPQRDEGFITRLFRLEAHRS